MDLCAFHWTYRSGQLYELTSRYPLSENSCRYKILSEKWFPHTRYTVNCETWREQYWNNDTAWSYIADIYDQEELDENDLLLGVQLHVFNIANKNEVHIFFKFNIIILQVPPPPPIRINCIHKRNKSILKIHTVNGMHMHKPIYIPNRNTYLYSNSLLSSSDNVKFHILDKVSFYSTRHSTWSTINKCSLGKHNCDSKLWTCTSSGNVLSWVIALWNQFPSYKQRALPKSLLRDLFFKIL